VNHGEEPGLLAQLQRQLLLADGDKDPISTTTVAQLVLRHGQNREPGQNLQQRISGFRIFINAEGLRRCSNLSRQH
jgi:hypothetical protein